MRWSITYLGRTWTQDDFSVALLITVATFAGVDDWTVVNPSSSPKLLAVFLAVLIAKETEQPLEAAYAHVCGLTPAELISTLGS